jgi:hypothetical protein
MCFDGVTASERVHPAPRSEAVAQNAERAHRR